MGPKKFSSFPLNEKFSGLSGLSGLVPNSANIEWPRMKGHIPTVLGDVCLSVFSFVLPTQEDNTS